VPSAGRRVEQSPDLSAARSAKHNLQDKDATRCIYAVDMQGRDHYEVLRHAEGAKRLGKGH